MLCSFHILGDIPEVFLLLVLMQFAVVKVRSLYDLNPLKFIETVLWIRIWTILVNTACVLEKKVYLAFVG